MILMDRYGINKRRAWFFIFFRCPSEFTEPSTHFFWYMQVCNGLIMLAAHFVILTAGTLLFLSVSLFKGRTELRNSLWGAVSTVEITWRPACAMQTWVSLTLDNCKKVDKNSYDWPIRRLFLTNKALAASSFTLLLKYTQPLISGDWQK